MKLALAILPAGLCLAGALVPSLARADCALPSDCLCSDVETPAAVLDVEIPAEVESGDPFEAAVFGVWGDDSVLGSDGATFEVRNPQLFEGYWLSEGDRVLLFVGAGGLTMDIRVLEDDGELSCPGVGGRSTDEVAALAMSEDCGQQANADLESCDDTGMSCSVSGAGPSVALGFLALLGLVRRRE